MKRVAIEEVMSMKNAMQQAKANDALVEMTDQWDEISRLITNGTRQGCAEDDIQLLRAVEVLSRLNCDLISAACSQPRRLAI